MTQSLVKPPEVTPEDLDRVAEIVRTRWSGSPRPNQGNKVCLLEALAEVVDGHPSAWSSPAMLALGADLFTPIICRDYPRRVTHSTGPKDVPWIFNDSGWTTRRAVLRVVRMAREKLT